MARNPSTEVGSSLNAGLTSVRTKKGQLTFSRVSSHADEVAISSTPQAPVARNAANFERPHGVSPGAPADFSTPAPPKKAQVPKLGGRADFSAEGDGGFAERRRRRAEGRQRYAEGVQAAEAARAARAAARQPQGRDLGREPTPLQDQALQAKQGEKIMAKANRITDPAARARFLDRANNNLAKQGQPPIQLPQARAGVVDVQNLSQVTGLNTADQQVIRTPDGATLKFNAADGSFTPMKVDPGTGQPMVDSRALATRDFIQQVPAGSAERQLRREIVQDSGGPFSQRLAMIDQARAAITNELLGGTITEEEAEEMMSHMDDQEGMLLHNFARMAGDAATGVPSLPREKQPGQSYWEKNPAGTGWVLVQTKPDGTMQKLGEYEDPQVTAAREQAKVAESQRREGVAAGVRDEERTRKDAEAERKAASNRADDRRRLWDQAVATAKAIAPSVTDKVSGKTTQQPPTMKQIQEAYEMLLEMNPDLQEPEEAQDGSVAEAGGEPGQDGGMAQAAAPGEEGAMTGAEMESQLYDALPVGDGTRPPTDAEAQLIWSYTGFVSAADMTPEEKMSFAMQMAERRGFQVQPEEPQPGTPVIAASGVPPQL